MSVREEARAQFEVLRRPSDVQTVDRILLENCDRLLRLPFAKVHVDLGADSGLPTVFALAGNRLHRLRAMDQRSIEHRPVGTTFLCEYRTEEIAADNTFQCSIEYDNPEVHGPPLDAAQEARRLALVERRESWSFTVMGEDLVISYRTHGGRALPEPTFARALSALMSGRS